MIKKVMVKVSCSFLFREQPKAAMTALCSTGSLEIQLDDSTRNRTEESWVEMY